MQLIVTIQKWKLAAAPLTLGHPDCRLLVRKRIGAPHYTALFNTAALCSTLLTSHGAEMLFYWSVEWCLVWISQKSDVCIDVCIYLYM